MAKYDRAQCVRRKPDPGKANFDIKQLLFQENISYSQIAAWVGVSTFTVSQWLSKPLTADRRRRIEDAISAIKKQRGEIDEQ